MDLLVQKEYEYFNIYSNCFNLPKHGFWKASLHLIHGYFKMWKWDFSVASLYRNPWLISWVCLLMTFSGHFMCKLFAICLLKFCSLKLHVFQMPSKTFRDMVFLGEETLNTNALLVCKLVESPHEGGTSNWSARLLNWRVLCFRALCL